MGYSDFKFITPMASVYEDITLGTAEASKAVVLDANKNINGIVLTSPKLNEDVVLTSTATELNVLDGVARGSVVVGGAAGTTVLDAKNSGQILVGDGNDVVSVVVGGDATLGSDGNLALAVPKLSYINKICAIADFTDDSSDENGYIDFTSQLPAGAIPLGWKAVVTEGFAGDTSAIIKVGTAGVPDGLSGNVTQSVFVPGIVGSNASCGSSSSYMGIAFYPRVTVTSGSDFSNVTAGAMTVYIYYIVTT